mgnify:CR=1 FL=1
MNSDIYIFGKLGTSYSQCPNDFTSEIFIKMGEWHSSTDTWISVHRKGALMYYGYIRKLGIDRYIGFCSVLNGMMVTDFNALFDIFDSMITHLAVSGEILKYSDTGDVVSNTQSLVYGEPVLNQTKVLLKDGLSELYSNLKKLPAESYGISVSENKQFNLHIDDMPQIVSASWNYCYTFITKDSGIPAPNSYQGILKQLSKEKQDLQVANSDLSNKVIKLERQKKQQGKVFTLGAAVVIIFFILVGIKQSLDETQNRLDLSKKILENTQTALDSTETNFAEAKKKYEIMQSFFLSKLSEKDHEITSLQKQNEQIVSDLEYVENELKQVQSENYDLRIKIARYGNQTNQQTKQPQTSYSNYYSKAEIKEATVVYGEAPLRKAGNFQSQILRLLDRDVQIEVFYNDYTNGYYKVRYRNITGYLASIYIKFK